MLFRLLIIDAPFVFVLVDAHSNHCVWATGAARGPYQICAPDLESKHRMLENLLCTGPLQKKMIKLDERSQHAID